MRHKGREVKLDLASDEPSAVGRFLASPATETWTLKAVDVEPFVPGEAVKARRHTRHS